MYTDYKDFLIFGIIFFMSGIAIGISWYNNYYKTKLTYRLSNGFMMMLCILFLFWGSLFLMIASSKFKLLQHEKKMGRNEMVE